MLHKIKILILLLMLSTNIYAEKIYLEVIEQKSPTENRIEPVKTSQILCKDREEALLLARDVKLSITSKTIKPVITRIHHCLDDETKPCWLEILNVTDTKVLIEGVVK